MLLLQQLKFQSFQIPYDEFHTMVLGKSRIFDSSNPSHKSRILSKKSKAEHPDIYDTWFSVKESEWLISKKFLELLIQSATSYVLQVIVLVCLRFFILHAWHLLCFLLAAGMWQTTSSRRIFFVFYLIKIFLNIFFYWKLVWCRMPIFL